MDRCFTTSLELTSQKHDKVSKNQQMKVSSWRLACRHKDGDQRITEDFQASEEEGFQRTEQDHRLWEVNLY